MPIRRAGEQVEELVTALHLEPHAERPGRRQPGEPLELHEVLLGGDDGEAAGRRAWMQDKLSRMSMMESAAMDMPNLYAPDAPRFSRRELR